MYVLPLAFRLPLVLLWIRQRFALFSLHLAAASSHHHHYNILHFNVSVVNDSNGTEELVDGAYEWACCCYLDSSLPDDQGKAVCPFFVAAVRNLFTQTHRSLAFSPAHSLSDQTVTDDSHCSLLLMMMHT